MKIQITITKEERNNTNNMINVDPCSHILCGQIDCENCPLRESVQELQKAKDKFLRALNGIEVENDD